MPADFKVVPVILEGNYARLEPLEARHAQCLAKHAQMDLFKFFAGNWPMAPTVPAVESYIASQNGLPNWLAFAIIDTQLNEAVGSTSYMDIRDEHRALEIGSTWLGKEAQGTKINPECKFLLLRHAFEELGAHRVQLKTDGRNIQSQRAIEKLGAKKEGVLRRHTVLTDGYVRDTVMYSIVDDEWPAVKARLLERIAAE